MGLVGKTGSAVLLVARYYGRAASAGSTLSSRATSSSTITHAQSRTHDRGRPRVPVLYIDRGVIVLNKPPGLVSQGTSTLSSVAPGPVTAKTMMRPPTTSGTVFDDVLDGTVITSF